MGSVLLYTAKYFLFGYYYPHIIPDFQICLISFFGNIQYIAHCLYFRGVSLYLSVGRKLSSIDWINYCYILKKIPTVDHMTG